MVDECRQEHFHVLLQADWQQKGMSTIALFDHSYCFLYQNGAVDDWLLAFDDRDLLPPAFLCFRNFGDMNTFTGGIFHIFAGVNPVQSGMKANLKKTNRSTSVFFLFYPALKKGLPHFS